MKITIGADPELFVRKNNNYISGHTFPCGTKEAPLKTPHGSVQVDGVALEFNVKPAGSVRAFVKNVKSAMLDLEDIVVRTDPEARLDIVPTAWFGFPYLDKLPENVRELGCNPDYDAYIMDVNPRPNPKVAFRTGAGHIHVGWTKKTDPMDYDHFARCAAVARQLDYYLGLPSLKWDNDTIRRDMYGKAGAFRPKPYGVEYRTLSNRWLSDPALIELVFQNTMLAMKKFDEGEELPEKYGTLAKNCINQNKRDWDRTYPIVAKDVLMTEEIHAD